jgi:hypothetical protein
MGGFGLGAAAVAVVLVVAGSFDATVTMTVASSGAMTATAATRLRTVLAYLVTVVGLTGAVVIAGAGGGLLPGSLSVSVVLAIALLPAATLARHLVSRAVNRSPIRHALLGAVSWTAWYLLVAVAVVVAGTLALWPEGFVLLLALIAIAGAIFGALAPAGRSPSSATTGAALLVAAGLIAACFVTAGRWGGPT